jgi:hypothetical protein
MSGLSRSGATRSGCGSDYWGTRSKAGKGDAYLTSGAAQFTHTR